MAANFCGIWLLHFACHGNHFRSEMYLQIDSLQNLKTLICGCEWIVSIHPPTPSFQDLFWPICDHWYIFYWASPWLSLPRLILRLKLCPPFDSSDGKLGWHVVQGYEFNPHPSPFSQSPGVCVWPGKKQKVEASKKKFNLLCLSHHHHQKVEW